mmetsp:Transcript_16483/g.28262  ORF Transcript_16483/g.28262 Transcript_16483/m.28262 type:complete len:95 (+) Transcript_16483:439-723(+)
MSTPPYPRFDSLVVREFCTCTCGTEPELQTITSLNHLLPLQRLAMNSGGLMAGGEGEGGVFAAFSAMTSQKSIVVIMKMATSAATTAPQSASGP